MADIAVERVEVNVLTSGQTLVITDVGNTENAFVRIVGATCQSSGGPTGSSGNAGPNDMGCRVDLIDTQNLQFTTSDIAPLKVMCEVWRYTGPAGGAYEFKVRQRGSVAFASGDTSNSAAVSGMTDRNDCVPIYSGFTCSQGGNNNQGQGIFGCYIDASNNIVFERGATGSTATCQYQVVEFTGSAWSVGHFLSTGHDTGNTFPGSQNTVTLNTDSTGAGGSTFDVGNWANAMILQSTMEGDTVEDGLSDCRAYVQPGASTTTVEFGLDNGSSRNDGNGRGHVIVCADMVMAARTTNTNYSENNGGGTYGASIAISSSSDMDALALEWYPGTNGEGNAHGRGSIHAQIIGSPGSYTIQTWVHRSGNNTKYSMSFADFTAMVDPGASSTLNVRVGGATVSRIYVGATEATRAYTNQILIHEP